jgi:hypothetical protein
LLEERGSAVSPPIVVALTLWLGLIFARFGTRITGPALFDDLYIAGAAMTNITGA